MTARKPIEPIPDDKNRVLIVEGKGDEYFFTKFLEYLGKREEVHIVDCEGKDNLATRHSNILNDDNYSLVKHIGIVLDNDYPDERNGKSAFETALAAIDTANNGFVENNPNLSRRLSKPQQARKVTSDIPYVSMLLLPSDNDDGMIENLILKAVGKDNIMDCVDGYLACLARDGLKAKVHRIPRSKLSIYISGKVIDEAYATNDDSRRAFLTQAVEMKWWGAEKMWDNCVFDQAKAFLEQLLAD